MSAQLKALSSIEITELTRSRAVIGRQESGQIIQLLHRLFGAELIGDSGQIVFHMKSRQITTVDFPQHSKK